MLDAQYNHAHYLSALGRITLCMSRPAMHGRRAAQAIKPQNSSKRTVIDGFVLAWFSLLRITQQSGLFTGQQRLWTRLGAEGESSLCCRPAICWSSSCVPTLEELKQAFPRLRRGFAPVQGMCTRERLQWHFTNIYLWRVRTYLRNR